VPRGCSVKEVSSVFLAGFTTHSSELQRCWRWADGPGRVHETRRRAEANDRKVLFGRIIDPETLVEVVDPSPLTRSWPQSRISTLIRFSRPKHSLRLSPTTGPSASETKAASLPR
jgi:hypothetical protein